MPPEVETTILRVVPHRAPILRIHRVVAADAATAVVAGTEPEGEGALPWELGAIEGLAQSTAVLLAQAVRPQDLPEAPRGMLVAVKRFVIEGQPPRGAEILYHVHLVRRLGPTAMVRGHAECDGRRLAGGELCLWAPGG